MTGRAARIAFWNIVRKDMRLYYLKPPNISWGMIFPLAWTLMLFLRTNAPVDIRGVLPGVMACPCSSAQPRSWR